MLIRFNDRIFLHETQWFIWESCLGLFRPIDGYAWDGTAYRVLDTAYCTDPLSKTYCFGTAELLAKCVELSKKYEPSFPTVPTASYLDIGTPTWFRDRPMTFTPCASRDALSWKRCVNGHARTCKQRSKKRFTKRNL